MTDSTYPLRFRIGPIIGSVNGVTVNGFFYRYICFVQAVHIVLSQVMFNQEYVNAFVTYMHTFFWHHLKYS